MDRNKSMPPELLSFVKDNCKRMNDRQLAEAANRQPWSGGRFTASGIKSFRQRNGIIVGRKNRPQKPSKQFPEEVANYIRENYKGVGPTEMTRRLQKDLGASYELGQIKAYYKNHHYNSGIDGRFKPGRVSETKGKHWDDFMDPDKQENSRKTTFKEGHIPANKLPVGTIRKNKDGYMLIKVQEHGSQWERWKMLHRLNWGKANGPIPRGKVLIFRNGNREDCRVENLQLISWRESQMMTRKKLRSEDPELTDIGLTTAKIMIKANDRRRKQ